MPDYLTVTSAAACLVLCAGLIASILAVATDDWMHIEEETIAVNNGITNRTKTAAIRYGLWRKCWVDPDGDDLTIGGITKSKHCVELVDAGTTAWVMASAVMMVYATVACAISLVLWIIWTFFIRKRSQPCLKLLIVVLVMSSIFFFFVVFIGWIAERDGTRDEVFSGQVNGKEYHISFKWSWGMVVLALFVQIIALVLILFSKERDTKMSEME